MRENVARVRLNRVGESKHSPRRIAAVAKQGRALRYRNLGLTYAQIAKSLPTSSRQAAWYCVDAALRRTRLEPTAAIRKLELGRLDVMFARVFQNACRGDLRAVNAALGIMDRRARLLGLDAPEGR